VAEVVIDDDPVAVIEEQLSDGSADVSGAAGDEYPQGASPFSYTFIITFGGNLQGTRERAVMEGAATG
jgi:hypothetical protein